MADRVTAAAKRLAALLCASGKTAASAESCTGGLVAAALTSIPGSSRYFLGGVVAYGNPAKSAMLGVPPSLIREHGAVSAAVAASMAEGALSRFRADLAIAVTGIAGPGGGTRGKPAGTVWVAVLLRGGGRYAHRFRFLGDRAAVRRESVRASLDAAVDLLAGRIGGPG